MLFIGTMSLKTKGMWTKNDYPFDALSTGAQKLVNQGWFRCAIQKTEGTDSCILQATVWMDRKLVGFLHTAQVTKSARFTVEQWDHQERK